MSRSERINKFLYEVIIQEYHTPYYGWEDVSTYEDNPEGRKQAREDIKEYFFGIPSGAFRIIHRRIPNPEYKS